MKKKYKYISRTVNEMLDIAPETDRDIVKITAVCNDDVLVQNFGRVYEYTDSCAAFINKVLIVEIHGDGLALSGVAAGIMRVRGNIDSILYKRLDK